MRRCLLLILGILEFTVAGMLVALGCRLPSTAEIQESFHRADRVTDRAEAQVRILHRQVAGVRHLELEQLAARLQRETRTVTATLRAQRVDFDTVQTMHDALGDVATGIDGLAATLDPVTFAKLSTGLGETASFLEDRLIPAANQAADHLEKSTAALRSEAVYLSTLLRAAPLDLQAVREVHEGLGRFRDGLQQMDRSLRPERLEVMRDGFQGLETSLSTGAEQVERLAGYSYPVVTFTGVRPQVTQRQFWPEGDRIAQGMRRAATGVTAADKQLEEIAGDLPRLRSSLVESCKMVDRLRQTLALALKQQDKVEPVLKDLPRQAARLAEELPRMSEDLARVLRDTRQLAGVAAALRQAQNGIGAAVARWPELRMTLTRMAAVLKAAQQQLDQVLVNRKQYEAALRQSLLLGESFTTMLPLVTDQLDSRLDEEEQALEGLGQSISDVRAALPVYEQTVVGMLQTGRWLAWLAAAIVGLHGGYLTLSIRMGRPYAI